MLQEVPTSTLHFLQSEIHYEFKQVKLLIQALTHSSYANEHGCDHNERLEFLGDAVLELAVSHILFTKFPEVQEGHLTKMRSSLVNETALAEVAHRLRIGSMLFLGKGEDAQGGREKNSVLSDALEAVLGAIFLDGGLEAATASVKILYKEQWPSPPATFRPKDYKSQLQEMTQRMWKERPAYILRESHGPEHAKHFVVQVMLPDGACIEWEASSMRKAEQGAAARALQHLQKKYPITIQDG